jgi:hypothetical protein
MNILCRDFQKWKTPQMLMFAGFSPGRQPDLNRRPADYESISWKNDDNEEFIVL